MTEGLSRENINEETIGNERLVRVICSWCGKEIETKESDNKSELNVSYSVCDECGKKMAED